MIPGMCANLFFQKDESIFFIETNEDLVDLRPRSLCALESAAKNNPNRTVFFLMSSKSQFVEYPEYTRKYANVKFRLLDIDHFTKVSYNTGQGRKIKV